MRLILRVLFCKITHSQKASMVTEMARAAVVAVLSPKVAPVRALMMSLRLKLKDLNALLPTWKPSYLSSDPTGRSVPSSSNLLDRYVIKVMSVSASIIGSSMLKPLGMKRAHKAFMYPTSSRSESSRHIHCPCIPGIGYVSRAGILSRRAPSTNSDGGSKRLVGALYWPKVSR